MKDEAFATICCVLILIAAVAYECYERVQCDALHGVLVRAQIGYACVQAAR